MVYRIIGLCILLAAGSISFFIFNPNFNSFSRLLPCVQQTPAEQLAALIGSDFAKLQKEKQLPKAWNSIASIEIRMNSTLAKAILGNQAIGIQRIQDGKHFLELDFIDLPDEESPGIIVQASLFNIKSKNKIFEIGRTYTISELNRKGTNKKEPEL